MTTPLQVSSDLLQSSTGYSADQWRQAARAAHEALRRNSRDVEARSQLLTAQQVLRQHAGQVGEATVLANQTAAQPTVGKWGGRIMAFGQGASMGFADELSGILAGTGATMAGLAPLAGEASRQATEQHREAMATARANDPTGTLVADAAGSTAAAVVSGSMLNKALPFLPRVFQAATEPITSMRGVISHVAPATAATAVGAGEVGLQVGARAAGETDGSFADRAKNAALGFGAGVVAGIPLSAAGVAAGTLVRTGLKGFRDARAAVRPDMIRAETPSVGVPTTPTVTAAPSGAPHADAEAALRSALQKNGVPQADIDAAVARSRTRFQGPGKGPVETPSMVQAGHPVTMVNPADVARAAHAQVMEATGNPEAAREAASRAAGFARAGQPTPPDNLMGDLQASVAMPGSMRINKLLAGQPTLAAQQELLDIVTPLSKAHRDAIMARLPSHWASALGIQ